WAANHHSWWDPFTGTALARELGLRSCVLMLQDNLDRFRFAGAIGAFGTSHLRRGLSYLDDGRVLLVYPEGRLMPPGPLGPLAEGAAWYALAARVPLYAVACRVVMRGNVAAEAYLSFREVSSERPPATRDLVTRRLARTLDEELRSLDLSISTSEPRLPLDGFSLVIRGRLSPDERIERRMRWLPKQLVR
ncbi:MAG TPA: 1-acyl-sn-glycerol-3-phosphate acyltransferase, partial [Gemmatimonadales bacterium]|nr:1-acyl-sn-glycerol-3-phosphate acyltransferase [Gemmatimonadales bacterium]